MQSIFGKTLVHVAHAPGRSRDSKDRIITQLTYCQNNEALDIYVGTSKGELYALRCEAGSERGKEMSRVKVSKKAVKMIQVCPDISRIIALCQDWRVYVLDLSNLKPVIFSTEPT